LAASVGGAAGAAKAVPGSPQHHAARVSQETRILDGQEGSQHAQIFEARTRLELWRLDRLDLIGKNIGIAESAQKNQFVAVAAAPRVSPRVPEVPLGAPRPRR